MVKWDPIQGHKNLRHVYLLCPIIYPKFPFVVQVLLHLKDMTIQHMQRPYHSKSLLLIMTALENINITTKLTH